MAIVGVCPVEGAACVSAHRRSFQKAASGLISLAVAIACSICSARAAGHAPVRARSGHSASAGAPMVYFRYASAGDCNVFMNYSYHDPKFYLKAINPAALTPDEAVFIDRFNSAFQTMIARHPDACHYDGNPYDLSFGQGQAIKSRCEAQEFAMGYGERSWSRLRLPAPTNCISLRDWPDGTVDIVAGPVSSRPMTLPQWMALANSGR